MSPENRLVLEALTGARNWAAPAAREVAGREAAAISLADLVRDCEEARGHILSALRSATLGFALVRQDQAEPLADAIRSLVRAARAEPIAPRGNATVGVEPRRYWVDQP